MLTSGVIQRMTPLHSKELRRGKGGFKMSEQGKSLINSRNVFIVIIVLLIGAVVYFAYFNKSGINLVNNKKETEQKSDKYQAVFLTNGQVYFGKLEDKGGDY